MKAILAFNGWPANLVQRNKNPRTASDFCVDFLIKVFLPLINIVTKYRLIISF